MRAITIRRILELGLKFIFEGADSQSFALDLSMIKFDSLEDHEWRIARDVIF
jgi:hypothetical protein